MLTHMPRSRHAPPKASVMLEALRGLGYSTATALADLIDNSIAAGTKTVHLRFSGPDQPALFIFSMTAMA